MENRIFNSTLRGLTFLFMILLLQACGSKTSAPETTPVPDAIVEIDTKAHSDSKGVGKFTEVKLEAIDPARAELGKAVFTTKCTTCHKLTADKFVGPGLEGITSRRTPEWIMNMITNPELMMKSDPVAKKLFEEILTPMANQNIGDEEARNILEYLRQNDNK
ncbi:MAG: cytochrome c [Bacteroidales bacterium]|nr:cytochrome c [Bacteroidales bacterium]MBK9358265.1 cytochrome c [Bacteroidales bacterium]